MTDRRAHLVAALGFARLRTTAPEVSILCGWLDSWRGIGDVIVGMHGEGHDAQPQ